MKPLFIPSIGALLGAAQLAATAAVYGWHSEVSANNTHPFAEFANHNAAVLRRQSKVPLRILTLGASIANGVGSSTGNGFRKPIRDALRFDGWEVNMVGSKQAGTMVDWDNEGTPSAIITDLYEYFPNSAGFKANVVLINLGTNDANGNIDVAHAGDRMEVLLSQIWDSPDMAKTCIILSTLIPSKKDAGKKNNPIINRQYRQLVSDLQSSKCIYLADMDPESGPAAGWLYNDISDVDFIHPNDLGHSKMAYIFWKALTRAANDGKIVSPAIIDLTGVQSGCDKKAGDGKYAGALTQQGWGIDDGIYYHDSEGMGTVLEINSAWDRNQWRFARLYGPKHDDFVGWFEKSTTEHAFGVWKNLGNGKFEKIADLNPDLFCNPAGVNFIDMNADGYDDLVCIDGNGNAYLSINQKDGTDTKPPTFKRVSDTALIKTNEGYPQDKVRMTDIDGDGRGDYCIIDGGGNIRCWRNGWVDDIPKYWQDLGQRFEAKGKGDYRGVRFVDMNGDGRDDWIWVSDIGAVETWTNARSCAEGKLGDGLNVAWRQGFHKGESDGDTHYGLPEDAKNDTALRDRIMFGRVYGEPEDLGLLGKMDYVYLQHEKIADDNHKFSMRVWKNTGFGGTKLKADGNKYCNMVGHEDGREDFVWTLSTGKMRLFPNKGLKQLTTGQSFWGASAIIWDPVQLINKELNRRDIHLMDWDGDGICDIVWLNPDNQNRPSVWINHYDTTKNWDAAATWEYYADPPSARAADVHCAETRGLDLHDLPVRFGDIDGNKRDDFLCIRPDGHVTAYVHNDDNSWKSIGQVKFEDGMDRANLRWADVNGDGKDDMIWINKFNGEGTAFYNRGYADPAKNKGSVIHWDKTPKAVYVTVHRAGTCIYFPDLDGNGRADLHAIGGTFTNTAETWFNPSCGLTDREGDDAGCCADPKLPVQPGSTDNGGGGGGGSGDNDDEVPPGGIFLETPSDDTDPRIVDSGCKYIPKVYMWGCNVESWKETPKSFDPRAVLRLNANDCTDRLEHIAYPWQCFCRDCTIAEAVDDETALTRWNSVLAQECMLDVTFWYSFQIDHNTLEEKEKHLPDTVGKYFGGIGTSASKCGFRSPNENRCDQIDGGGCAPLAAACGVTSYAALDLVLTSFYHVWNTHQKMFTALEGNSVVWTLVNRTKDLEKTFVTEKGDSLLSLVKNALGYLDVIYPIAAASVWSKFLSSTSFDNYADGLDKAMGISDSINNAIGVYELAGGTASTLKEQEMETEMILEKAIGILVNAGQASVRATMEHIYSGTDQGTADLQGMLGNGVFLNDPSGDFSSPQIGDLFADATLVQLILLAWSLGQGQTPIVLYDKAGVDHPLKELVPSVYDAYFKPSAAAKTRFPGDFKGSDGNLYSVWLVDFSNFYDDGSFDTKYLFKELKGQDKLVYDDPKIGNEWGVSWHEYLESSFEGYLRNKKTNPYPLVSSSKLEYGDKDSGNFFALQKGTSSPGLIKLPVCTAYLVYENIAHWDDVKNQHPCDVFPCCLIDWKLSGNSPCEGLGPRCEPNGL